MQAYNVGSRLSAFTTLEVNLQDVNDESPKFILGFFVVAVPEEKPAPFNIIKVEASDADTEPDFRRVGDANRESN